MRLYHPRVEWTQSNHWLLKTTWSYPTTITVRYQTFFFIRFYSHRISLCILLWLGNNIHRKSTNMVKFDPNSFSDDQSATTLAGASSNNRTPSQSSKRKSSNQHVHSSSSSASSFSPYHHLHNVASVGNYQVNESTTTTTTASNGGRPIMHRQSSSFDTAMIDTSETFATNVNSRQMTNDKDEEVWCYFSSSLR